MDKTRAGEKIKYVEKLDPEEKVRYLEKVKLAGCDPYEVGIEHWTRDIHYLPPVDYSKILQYLVLGVSYYTVQQFCAYKSLEAYAFVTSKFVHHLYVHLPDEPTGNFVIKAKVRLTLTTKECSLLEMLSDSQG